VDLSADTSLLVDISDALSERDKVKFTVHTKVRRGAFRRNWLAVWSVLWLACWHLTPVRT